jgi:hypothetical protein
MAALLLFMGCPRLMGCLTDSNEQASPVPFADGSNWRAPRVVATAAKEKSGPSPTELLSADRGFRIP